MQFTRRRIRTLTEKATADIRLADAKPGVEVFDRPVAEVG
jgi:hypothetical protein